MVGSCALALVLEACAIANTRPSKTRRMRGGHGATRRSLGFSVSISTAGSRSSSQQVTHNVSKPCRFLGVSRLQFYT